MKHAETVTFGGSALDRAGEVRADKEAVAALRADDAARAIPLYCDLVSRAALDGMTGQMEAAGVDLGALEDAPAEELLAGAQQG